MTDFITSDLHFYHRKILEFCPESRPFASLDEMHDFYIEQINAHLLWNYSHEEQRGERLSKRQATSQKDANHLYILGDFSFKGKARTEEILERLPCRQITLVLGNHDYHHERLYRKYFHDVVHYLEKYVYVDGEKHKVVMSHYPIEDWNQKNHGSVHLHGHQHSSFKSGARRRDVGVDGWKGPHFIRSLENVVRDALMDEVMKTHHVD